MRRNCSGQSALEYILLLVIIIAALVLMQIYIKRGVQGRWKASVDEIGDQYDPNHINSHIAHRIVSNSVSRVYLIKKGKKNYTMREDWSVANESKTGVVQVWE